MTAPRFPADLPVDTVGDGTEYAAVWQVFDAFGADDWVAQGGFTTMTAARAWAKTQPVPAGRSIGYTGAYRVLRKEHRDG